MEEKQPEKEQEQSETASATSEVKTTEENKTGSKEEKSKGEDVSEKKTSIEVEEIIYVKVKPVSISEVVLNTNLIKKRGFLISVEGDGQSQTLLDSEIQRINTQYENIIKDFKDSEKNHLEQLTALNDQTKTSLVELERKKEDYDKRIKEEIPKEREEIEKKVNEVKTEIFDTLRAIGKQKENIVELSIESLRANIKKGISVNREVQDEQNAALNKEFESYKSINEKKINFWEELLKKYTDYHEKVMNRLKILSKDGINNQTSSFLLFLGSIAALVSGWWFSLWTGPLPKPDELENVAGNTSVKFFFLDNVGKFLSKYSLTELAFGLVIYIFSVGVLSWFCYLIAVKFGFTIGRKKKKSKKVKDGDSEEDPDYEVDLNEDDDILKTRFRANNWWAMWLKIAPFLLAIIPILAIISKQVDAETAEKAAKGLKETDSFQSLFDSIVNQFIGTCIAISFSTFTILFFSRVTENKYHEDDNKKKGGFVFYFGFIIFFLMIISMLLYHNTIGFNDVRKIAIIGFLVSCIATGFSMGYGYLFRSLHETSELLLIRIDDLSTIIKNISRPYHVNYTSNKLLQFRIYQLQQKIFQVIAERHELAIGIASGADIKEPEPILVKPPSPPQEKSKNKRNKKNNEADHTSRDFLNLALAFRRLKQFFEKKEKLEEKQKQEIVHNISNIEMIYFAEKAEQIGELNKKLKDLNTHLEKIDAEERDFWRNDGTYKSIRTQIKAKMQEVSNSAFLLAKANETAIVEIKKVEDKREEEKTLVKEGYYTGQWLKTGNHNADFELIPENHK